jgi:hypothetical protein
MLYILTLDETKDALGIKDSEDDGRVTDLLTGLQGRFALQAKRTFLYAAGIEEIFDGDQQWLLVKAFPVDSITSIHISDDQEWDADSLLDDGDYTIHKSRGRLIYGTGNLKWPKGVQNIRVVYTGGLIKDDYTPAPGADTDEIEALKNALRMQANFEWRNRQNLGQQAVSAQGVNVTLAKAELLPEVKTILNGLRRY